MNYEPLGRRLLIKMPREKKVNKSAGGIYFVSEKVEKEVKTSSAKILKLSEELKNDPDCKLKEGMIVIYDKFAGHPFEKELPDKRVQVYQILSESDIIAIDNETNPEVFEIEDLPADVQESLI